MDSDRRKSLKAILKRLENPAAILDKELKCVCSNRPAIFQEGSDLAEYFQGDIRPPVERTVQTMFTVSGKSYCARLFSLGEDMLLCELFGADALMDMAEKTDLYQKTLPFFNAVEYSTAKLWQTLFAMKDCIKNGGDIKGFDGRFYYLVSELSSVVKNGYEYSLMLTRRDLSIINIVSLAEGLVNRCNTILAECGRCVKFISDTEKLLVAADSRHAVTALTNSIQNALLYSPRDCVPVMTISRCTENGRSCVFIQLVNDSSLFIEENDETEFRFRRAGSGIPIIKRFAEEADGRFFLDSNGQIVKLGIVIPEAKPDVNMTVEEGGYSYYDTGIPDIVEVKMREVIRLFT
ncbi:MAG: hypothetical protein K2N38_13310 [Oscillospiraceae bacterium]|nr:hypothetical protein [Oscillospiraceae bacterium]